MIERYERRLHYNKKSNQKNIKIRQIMIKTLFVEICCSKFELCVVSRSAYSNGVCL
jgi:hypothetical protein